MNEEANRNNSFNNFPDQEFLATQNREMAQQTDFASQIERLHQEELGRAIAVTKRPNGSDQIVKEVIGYILPIDISPVENMKHLIIMKDGSMAVVAPRSDYNSKRYQETFSPSEATINLRPEDNTQISVGKILENYPLSDAEPLLMNDRPEDLSQIDEAVDKAFEAASGLRLQRLEARRKSMSSFRDKANRFFHSKERPDLYNQESQPSNEEEQPPFPPSAPD